MAGDKTHMEDPKEWKFKRNRNGNEHVESCADGYFEPKGRDPNVLEIHHALCIHACSDSTFPDDITEDEKTFIYACFAITEWNINGPDNNIGLPKKWAYVEDPSNGTNWGQLPCHQVDHDRYLYSVETYVEEEIWMKVKKAKKQEKCEEITGENIARYFNAGSKRWKKFLKARGSDYGGTKKCLDYCTSGASDPELEANWYVPFSMAIEGEVRPRRKPPSGETLKRLGLLKAID